MLACRTDPHLLCFRSSQRLLAGMAGCLCHGLNIGYLERCVEETKFKYVECLCYS